MDLAEQMLINGAEIYRVEDCINRIFMSNGVKRVDTFIITSSMVVSVSDNEGNVFTQTRRIGNVSTDIERLHKLNALSRYICSNSPDVEEIKNRLNDISSTPTYHLAIKVAANAVIAGSFTLFFGGTCVDSIVSFAIGAIMQFAFVGLNKINTNKLFEKFICSLIVSLLAFTAVKISIVSGVDKIVIGNIMSMIPGVGFTNALRDLFKGDIFAGVHRGIESLLISAAIAAGYVLTAVILGGVVL